MVKRHKILIIVVSLAVVFFVAFAFDKFFVLRKAHNTFENYYAFRRCIQLVEKTDTYGICKTSSGEIIKIVEIQNKWYLDGDGPGVW